MRVCFSQLLCISDCFWLSSWLWHCHGTGPHIHMYIHTYVRFCLCMNVCCFSFTYVAVSLGTICSISSASVISTSISDDEEISSRSLSLISMTSIRNNKYGAVKWPLLGRSLFVLFFSPLCFALATKIRFWKMILTTTLDFVQSTPYYRHSYGNI